MKRIVFVAVALALSVSSFAEETIDGQVFIATEGGENIRLGLVQVSLFDLKTVEEHLDKKRKAARPIEDYLIPLVKPLDDASKRASDAATAAIYNDEGKGFAQAEELQDKAIEAYIKMHGMADYTNSTFYFFEGLPNPLQTTKTDADGKFTFKVPSGSYVLLATSSRKAGTKMVGDTAFPITEYYNWMIQVTADTDKKVMLANDNLSSSGSAVVTASI